MSFHGWYDSDLLPSSSASLGVLGEAGAAVLSWNESRGESHPPPGFPHSTWGFLYQMGISGDFNVQTNKGNFSNFVESETHSTSQKLIECGHMTK